MQEITNKSRHADRDHADQIQRYENELKSLRLRSESGVDLLRKENDLTKSKATKTIDELEKQLSTITEKFFDMQKLFEQKLAEQQTNYQNNIQQCEHDYEKKLQSLKQDLKQFNEKYQLLAQHHEQAQNELKQKNHELKQYTETCTQQRELIEKSEKAFVQIKTDLEKKFHEKVSSSGSVTQTMPSLSRFKKSMKRHVRMNNSWWTTWIVNTPKSARNSSWNTSKAKISRFRKNAFFVNSFVVLSTSTEETLRNSYKKDLEEVKRKYEQSTDKQEEKMKNELQQIDKLSVEKKLAHENEKQQVM